MQLKRIILTGLAAFTLAAAPTQAQQPASTRNDSSVERNLDENLLVYAALPLLIAIALVIAASSGGDSRPASA